MHLSMRHSGYVYIIYIIYCIYYIVYIDRKKIYNEFESNKLPELNCEKLEEIENYLDSLTGRSDLYFMKDYKDVHNQVETNREVRENEEESAKLAIMSTIGIYYIIYII